MPFASAVAVPVLLHVYLMGPGPNRYLFLIAPLTAFAASFAGALTLSRIAGRPGRRGVALGVAAALLTIPWAIPVILVIAASWS